MNNKNEWDSRKVDFSKIHGNEEDAFASLVLTLNVQNDETIGDIMGGYGGVSRKVLEDCSKRGIFARVILLDGSEEQLKKSYEYLTPFDSQGYVVKRAHEDIRNISLESVLNKAVIKMGLHEVRKNEQVDVLRNIYYALKSDGEVYVWDCFGANKRLNDYFRRVVRKKDRLAGYSTFVKNRYFANESEIIKSLRIAGFDEIAPFYEGVFNYQTKNFLCDFGGNLELLKQFNNYVRTELPEDVKRRVNFHDSGESISLDFTKKIFRAVKKY